MRVHSNRSSFSRRLARVGLFALALALTLGATIGAVDAAAKSGGRAAAPMRPAISKPAASLPSGNFAPRLAPGSNLAAIGSAAPVNRLDPGAGLRAPTLTRLPPGFTPTLPSAGIVKDPGGNGAPPTSASAPSGSAPSGSAGVLPRPSAEDANRRLGACLVGIASACNGSAPQANNGGAGNGGATNGGGMTGSGSGSSGGSGGASGGGSGGGGSFSPSFSFGGGGSDGSNGDTATQSAAASGADQAEAAPACVADPTDIYKRLECNLADFNAGKIDRKGFEASKAETLALLDPQTLGTDLVFKVLRELVDLKLITAQDREAQKRQLLARL